MFTVRDCVFMAINCVVSGAVYFGLVSVNSKSLGDACPCFEDVMLIVLILRIYLLPIITIFKMGLDVCESHGDHFDLASIVVFVSLQLHYGIIRAYMHHECYEFLRRNDHGLTILTVMIAIVVDLLRIAQYLTRMLCFRSKPAKIRMDEKPDKEEKTMLIPVKPIADYEDDLLAELDGDAEYIENGH